MTSSSSGDAHADPTDTDESLSLSTDEQAGQSVPIVGIGASAGGVSALQDFFEYLPDETGMAFLVALHLAPDHESNLVEILQNVTGMPVQTAEETPLRPDHVYVLPPDAVMRIEDNRMQLSPRAADGHPTTVDILLRSLAEEYGERAVGIVLSGTGTDGTLGIRAIKAQGGLAMVQSPVDAGHEGMPRSALDGGMIDLVGSADELAERLFTYYQNARTVQLPKTEEALPTDDQTTLREVFAELKRKTGHDFSHYKRSTVLRRLERRLQVTDLDTLEEYLELLRDQPTEVQALFRELLISVTRFFRTPEAFEALADTVIPSLFEDKTPNEEVRAWVVGCATGEEAYSVGMLLHEYAHTLDAPPALQIFATDVDTEALETARQCVYPETIEADVSTERLERFFRKEDNQYRVTRPLRDSLVFAEHDLIQDPPFSDLDLVCCRNVLIYLDQVMQEYVFRLFRYALNPGKYLFLGSSEAVGPAQSFFSMVEDTRSILKLKSPQSEEVQHVPLFPPSQASVESSARPTEPVTKAFDMTTIHQRLLMRQVASLVVDENHEIVHLTDRASRFLQHEAGEPTHNLLEKVPPVLRLELRGALFQAFQKGEATERTVPFPVPEGPSDYVKMTVHPVEDAELDRALVQVQFEAIEEPGLGQVEQEASEGLTDREEDLEEELHDTQEQLHITAEEYETVTEEMEAANEELMSMNEELQSKNEELKTSKEQLRSVNEELTTTNQELQAKVEALDRANSDLKNLMEATEVATLFLDREMKIQRYTPPITKIFSLRDSDVDRPITDFTPKIEYESLIEDVQAVLQNQASVEHEVRGDDGAWYLVRLRPYRTVREELDGVVLTFVDITDQKRAAEKLREERDLISALIDTAGALIVVLDADGSVVRFNTACERLTGYSAQTAEGRDLRDLLVSSNDWDAVTSRLRALAEGTTDRADLEMQWVPKAGDQRLIKSSFTALRDDRGSVQYFIVTGTDLTRHRELEREIVEISDRERRRIGEDLHDVVSSGLTSAMMRAENLAVKLEKDGVEVEVEDLKALSSKIKNAGDQARALSHALVPKALRKDDLASALADLAEEEKDFSDVPCVFSGDADETRPHDDTVAMNLYRIAHEAVANAREHANASQITIELREYGTDLVLSVRDDGEGWDEDTPPEEGLGLHLMRYRANLIGASLSLAREDGETVVECRLPLS